MSRGEPSTAADPLASQRETHGRHGVRLSMARGELPAQMPLIRVHGWLSGVPAVTAVRDNAVAWAPAAPQHAIALVSQPKVLR